MTRKKRVCAADSKRLLDELYAKEKQVEHQLYYETESFEQWNRLEVELVEIREMISKSKGLLQESVRGNI